MMPIQNIYYAGIERNGAELIGHKHTHSLTHSQTDPALCCSTEVSEHQYLQCARRLGDDVVLRCIITVQPCIDPRVLQVNDWYN